MAKKPTDEQRRQWAANALARAARASDEAARNTFLQIARRHLLEIVQEECHEVVTEKTAVAPSGIW